MLVIRSWCATAALAVLLVACGADDGDGIEAATTTRAPAPIDSALVAGEAQARIRVGDDCLDVLVADTVDERTTGLSDKDSLGRFAGMLFVWDTDVESAFYMYRTRIPLTIGWYGADGNSLGRAEMEPCPEPVPEDCPRYPPPGRYRYALEVGSGELPAGALAACPA